MKGIRLLPAALALVVAAAAAAQDEGTDVRRHRGGRTVRFDPARAVRALDELERKLSGAKWNARRSSVSLDRPFNGALPSCTKRTVRTVRRKVPAPLIGKTMLWTKTGGEADVVFRTEARSVRMLIQSGALPGDATLAKLWGVECAPSRVTFLSDHAVRIEEQP
ncbi:MAG: hypothetical protein ACYTAF_02265 [Planctomycetota bacterium]|jgi:hypothetical protein